MKQYRIFRWDGHNDLRYLGEEITENTMYPGMELYFSDTDDEMKNWIISEVHFPNPRSFTKPNGFEYHPDPIVILTKEMLNGKV